MLCLEFLNSKKNGNIKDLLKRNSSSSAFPYNAFVLRPTNVGQGLFLCGQQPSASSPVTLRFICTFFGENNLNQKKTFSNTVPTAPMPSKHSISAARSSHSTIYTQFAWVK